MIIPDHPFVVADAKPLAPSMTTAECVRAFEALSETFRIRLTQDWQDKPKTALEVDEQRLYQLLILRLEAELLQPCVLTGKVNATKP